MFSKNRCKSSAHIFVLFWSLTTLTLKFSQTKQLLSIYNVWKILWAGLKGSTQRKIMMLKSEMTFTSKLHSVGSRLRIFLSWLAGCFRFLLSFLAKYRFSKNTWSFLFSLEKVTRKIFCVYLASQISSPPPLQSLYRVSNLQQLLRKYLKF